jgi:sec-independent protein translocase protein TatB
MFDFGWSELAVIAVVALVVIGPKDLPRVLRTAGFWMRKVRTIASEFQSSIEQMAREAELDELRKQVEEANKAKQELEDQLSADAAKIAAGAANLIDDPSIMPPRLESDAAPALPPGEAAPSEPQQAVPEPPILAEPPAAQPPESIASAQPPESIASAQPPESLAAAQPPEPLAAAQAPESAAQPGPAETSRHG